MGAAEDHEKAAVARAAAALVGDRQRIALGSGTTVAQVVLALADQRSKAQFAAASPATAAAIVDAGLRPADEAMARRYDLAIDGADEVAEDGWLIKGGGGAHTRERILIAAADRFVCVVGVSKLVPRLTRPVPLELSAFGLTSTLHRLPGARLRDAPMTPDGGRLADLTVPLDDPRALAARLDATPGVIDHGLFAPETVGQLLIARGETIERR